MANLTANATGNLTAADAGSALDFFTVGIPAVASRFWDLISAPFYHSHMQWIIIPLILTFIISEFYFYRHTDEELGWNAALVNSLVLVFIAIDLTKTVFAEQPPVQVAKLFLHSLSTGENFSIFAVILFIGGLGLTLAIINYLHLLPRRLAYQLSSHPPINYIAYVAIVLVYSAHDGDPVPMDAAFVIAATILFFLLVLSIFMLQRMLGSKNNAYYNRE